MYASVTVVKLVSCTIDFSQTCMCIYIADTKGAPTLYLKVSDTVHRSDQIFNLLYVRDPFSFLCCCVCGFLSMYYNVVCVRYGTLVRFSLQHFILITVLIGLVILRKLRQVRIDLKHI